VGCNDENSVIVTTQEFVNADIYSGSGQNVYWHVVLSLC
jgi:hypothetical protein